MSFEFIPFLFKVIIIIIIIIIKAGRGAAPECMCGGQARAGNYERKLCMN